MLIKDMIITQEEKYNLLEIKWNLLSEEKKYCYTFNILNWCKDNRDLFGYNFIEHLEERKNMKYTDNLNILDHNTINYWNYEEKWNKRVELWSNISKVIYKL